MQNFTNLIETVDLDKIEEVKFNRKLACCLVLTKDRKILLQMRTEKRKSFPKHITTFGGKIEPGESPIQALIRELHEELGAKVNEANVVSFGAITEEITKYTELVYVYFWHDHLQTISGCYEDSPVYFDDVESVKENPKVMDYVHWLLRKCKERGLLP